MTKQQAMALARKKWGKKARLEQRDAPDRDTREILRKELERLKSQQPVKPPPTPEELKYYADLRKWREETQRIRGHLLCHRWSIGHITDLGPFAAFHIEGQGDTLEEACQKATLLT